MQDSSPKKKINKPQTQPKQPGLEHKMTPQPDFDHGLKSGIRLKGKKCVITGGDSGIGRAVAVAFAAEGADVAILYLKSEQKDADDTVKYIQSNYEKKCLALAVDISKEKNCIKAIEKITESFARIDVLVNNAAVHYPADDITKISDAQLRETFEVNIFSMFYLVKAALPFMRKGSNIINTSSVTAYRGSGVLIDYSATKGAIVSFTRSLSANLIDKKIRVNGVSPGPVWTPLIPSSFKPKEVATFGSDCPMGRPAQPYEIASAFVYLASEDASFVSGQIIHVNGGEIVNG